MLPLIVGAVAIAGGLFGAQRVLPRSEAGRLRKLIRQSKEPNATLHMELAMVLLSAPAETPWENVTLKKLQEGRKHAELANSTAPESWEAYRAERQLHLALGNAEESLLPSSFVLKGDLTCRGYTEHADAMIAATCSNACWARYLEQNKDQESRGMQTASARRAAAMWRVMEAGKLYLNASLADPSNAAAAAKANATAKFRELEAFKVSTTNELFDLANCRPYVGVVMDGQTCPPGRKKTKKKPPPKPIVNYNTNSYGPGVVKRD